MSARKFRIAMSERCYRFKADALKTRRLSGTLSDRNNFTPVPTFIPFGTPKQNSHCEVAFLFQDFHVSVRASR